MFYFYELSYDCFLELGYVGLVQIWFTLLYQYDT